MSSVAFLLWCGMSAYVKVDIGYANFADFGGFTIEMALLAGMLPTVVAADRMFFWFGCGYWFAALRSSA